MQRFSSDSSVHPNVYKKSTEDVFTCELSKSNHTEFRAAWARYTNTVSLMIAESKDDQDQRRLYEASKGLIKVFANENRFSFRQTKKAIENAFVRWNAMLLRYIQNEDANAFKRLMDDLNLMIPSFSRVLGGGRKNV